MERCDGDAIWWYLELAELIRKVLRGHLVFGVVPFSEKFENFSRRPASFQDCSVLLVLKGCVQAISRLVGIFYSLR